MASGYTTNKAVEKPASGDYVGTWATPANSNYDVLDQALGTIQVIDLSGGSVVLSTAQARSAFLNFIGSLPGNVSVTIPGLSSSPGTIVSGGFYSIENACANSSIRTVTLLTTVAGQLQICAPPGDAVDIKVEGSGSSQAGSIKFRNLGRVGSFWDYAGSSVPAWVSGCTVPPYLACNGTTFSSATYPTLAMLLGTTTLPDTQGRFRATLNSGTGRITTAGSSLNGNVNFSGGGSEFVGTHTHTGTLPQTRIQDGAATDAIGVTGASATTAADAGFSFNVYQTSVYIPIYTPATALTINNAGTGGSANIPPAYIGGVTMIRAA